MSNSLEIKVCGLTRQKDVCAVLKLGADFLGFITYDRSPRGLAIADACELASTVPAAKRVAVDVAPSMEKILELKGAGFDFFQIHAEASIGEGILAAWSEAVGSSHLWLAPRLKPGDAFPQHFLKYTNTILLDTYSNQQVGGTGSIGDWATFAGLKEQYRTIKWILAGGLNSGNITEAIAVTGAEHIDVNSGVESAPGVKDVDKLQQFFATIRT